MSQRGANHERHRCPGGRRRPHRPHTGRFPDRPRNPGGRGRQVAGRREHLPRGRGQRPHPGGARRPRRGPPNGQGRAHRAAIHHAGGTAHPDPRRLQRAADEAPVHADALPGRHRAAAAGATARTGRRSDPAEDPEPYHPGRSRRHGHLRRRRDHQGRATSSEPTACTAPFANRPESVSPEANSPNPSRSPTFGCPARRPATR